MTSGTSGRSFAANQFPLRPSPVTISSKPIRNPCRSRRSASPSQKVAGGLSAGSAAALIASQKKSETDSGPTRSRIA